MSVDEAIVAIFEHKLFKDMCRRYGGSDWQDLRSEVILAICEMPEHKKVNIIQNNYLLPYALSTIRQQAYSKEWTQFRKLYCNREGLVYENMGWSVPVDHIEVAEQNRPYSYDDDQRQTMLVNRIISDAINPQEDKHYYAYLMVENANGVPLRDIAENLGIPLTSVWKGIKQYNQYVKEWLKSAI
jgi:DNA-directed RNA polymerase specialized sigma24 family protein